MRSSKGPASRTGRRRAWRRRQKRAAQAGWLGGRVAWPDAAKMRGRRSSHYTNTLRRRLRKGERIRSESGGRVSHVLLQLFPEPRGSGASCDHADRVRRRLRNSGADFIGWCLARPASAASRSCHWTGPPVPLSPTSERNIVLAGRSRYLPSSLDGRALPRIMLWLFWSAVGLGPLVRTTGLLS